MSAVRFEPSIRYCNDLLLPVSLYRSIRVPAGVSPREPRVVSAQEMFSLAPANTIRVVGGLTKADFSIRFSNFTQQWQCLRTASAPPRWKFQGGTVYFDLAITLYVAQGFRENTPVFELIMDHELLHVADEIDIVSRYLPAQAPRDDYVKRYLIDQQPIDDRMFQTWFRGKGFQDWIYNGIWAPEHNRRARSRDSGTEWTHYRQSIDSLMRSTR